MKFKSFLELLKAGVNSGATLQEFAYFYNQIKMVK